MKEKYFKGLVFLASLVISITFTYAWYNAPIFASPSEYIWGIFNKLLHGTHPGYASDFEFLTVAGLSFSFFYFLFGGIFMRNIKS